MSFDLGFNGKTRVVVAFSPEALPFRDVRDCGDIVRMRHAGWYTDSDCNSTAIGIVARATHGRFVAGYRCTDTGEHVIFTDSLFDDESEAARRADSHAEYYADESREYSERFDAMQRAEIAAGDAAESLRDTWALRRAGRRNSSDVADAIEALRRARETLADATREYEGGPESCF